MGNQLSVHCGSRWGGLHPVDYGQVFGDVLVLDASTGELRWRYLMDRPPSHLDVVGGSFT